jgi:hypothetical protein
LANEQGTNGIKLTNSDDEFDDDTFGAKALALSLLIEPSKR